MIDYLEKLVADGEYGKALTLAAQLLLNVENTAFDLLRLNNAFLRSRFETGEYHGAVVSGQLALKLAIDLEAWDYHGHVCQYLGLSHYRLCQWDKAMDYWFQYLSHRNCYGEALRHEVAVWYNQGVIYYQNGDTARAMDAFRKAIETATRNGNDRQVHGLQHALIGAYMGLGELQMVPGLLAKCLYYLRHNPTAPDYDQSRMYHYCLRVEFCLKTGRFMQAKRLALFGLRLCRDWPRGKYEFWLLLAKISKAEADITAAIGHAVMARNSAIECRRFDLELEAAEYMYELMSAFADRPADAFRIIDAISPRTAINFGC